MNRIWSQNTEEFILNNCEKLKDKEIINYLASHFNIITTIDALRKKRTRMGLKKKSGRGVSQLLTAFGLKGCNLSIKGVAPFSNIKY